MNVQLYWIHSITRLAAILVLVVLAWAVLRQGWDVLPSSQAGASRSASYVSVQAPQESTAVVSVLAPEVPIEVSSVFSLTVTATHVNAPLSAFQFDLGYDANLLEFRLAEAGPFLGSTGQEVVCPAPAQEPGMVRLACASTGPEAGPTGEGVLAMLTFQAQDSGATALAVGNIQLADTGRPPSLLPATGQDGVVEVITCLFAADFTGSGDVNIVDVMEIARRFGAKSGDPLYEARFDLNDNGEIDVVDIMTAAAQWRAAC